MTSIGAGDSIVTTTQTFGLLDRSCNHLGNEMIYVQASGAIAQYAAVGVDETGQAAELTKAMADDGYHIAFAQVAFADNEYGWVVTRGQDIECKLAASCAADVALYTTATAGVLDDLSTSQTKIDGVVSVETITAATNAEIIATWPKSTTF
tara:strand:+ start:245 stop:697 length:453 start_codon:yes stop_codon:yes gene_type:complete